MCNAISFISAKLLSSKDSSMLPPFKPSFDVDFIYSGIRLLATRVLLIKWLLIREVANKGTELTQNLHLGPEDWLLILPYYQNCSISNQSSGPR